MPCASPYMFFLNVYRRLNVMHEQLQGIVVCITDIWQKHFNLYCDIMIAEFGVHVLSGPCMDGVAVQCLGTSVDSMMAPPSLAGQFFARRITSFMVDDAWGLRCYRVSM